MHAIFYFIYIYIYTHTHTYKTWWLFSFFLFFFKKAKNGLKSAEQNGCLNRCPTNQNKTPH